MFSSFFGMDKEIRIVLDEGAFPPTRAHEDDAGLDLYAREDKVVPAGGSAVFDTGVHIELPVIDVHDGIITERLKTVGFIKSKSGLYFKHGIVSDGTIDAGYSGSIAVKLYNLSKEDYEVRRGDKVSQLCIIPVITKGIKVVDQLSKSDRGEGGFGSTGR